MLDYMKRSVTHYTPGMCINGMNSEYDRCYPTIMCVRSAYESVKRTLKDDLSHRVISGTDHENMMKELDSVYGEMRMSDMPFHQRSVSRASFR